MRTEEAFLYSCGLVFENDFHKGYLGLTKENALRGELFAKALIMGDRVYIYEFMEAVVSELRGSTPYGKLDDPRRLKWDTQIYFFSVPMSVARVIKEQHRDFSLPAESIQTMKLFCIDRGEPQIEGALRQVVGALEEYSSEKGEIRRKKE